MAFSAAGKSGQLAEINVTPLVDVMLVLLIIFIVTAPNDLVSDSYDAPAAHRYDASTGSTIAVDRAGGGCQ